jgi:D-3-phosphoglycerate dehydrogenase
MAKVLVSDQFAQEGLDLLEKAEGIDVEYKPGMSEDELVQAIGEFDGLIIRSASKVTKRVIEAANNLKVIGRAGIGTDNIDKPEATRRGIVVMNTPTGNAVTTAEHAIALLFAAARRIGRADATMKQGQWEKKKLKGRELSGKTLGIIGLGNIGRIVADRAKGLRMSVIAYDPVLTAERAAELGVELVALDELFQRADAITAHTPLTVDTKGMVNDTTIAKMKRGVILVNAARGGVYDEGALLRGLESGQVGAVGIDVYPEEPPGATALVKHENVVATPHLGASTEEAQTRVAVEIADQIVMYLTTGTIKNALNVPSVSREMAPVLGPYTELGKRLGQFLGQVESIEPKEIVVEFSGEVAGLTVAPIVNATLAGLLERFLDGPVNPVNAPVAAKDRGIDVKELKGTASAKFATLISLSVAGHGGRQAAVSGTLAADRTARLVRWGNCELDAHLNGSILVMKNEDRPGVIGSIGTILGESGINVSRMQMGLDSKTRLAGSLWALDSELLPAVLDGIRANSAVRHAVGVVVG